MVVEAGPANDGLTQLGGLYRQVQARPPAYEFTTEDLADPARRYRDLCIVVDAVTSAVVKAVNAKNRYPIHHKRGITDPRRYFWIDLESNSCLAVIAPISRHAVVGSPLALSVTSASRSRWLPAWQAAGLEIHEDPLVPCVTLPFDADTAIDTVVDRPSTASSSS